MDTLNDESAHQPETAIVATSPCPSWMSVWIMYVVMIKMFKSWNF